MRFFFDYTTKDQSLRDYQGDEFLSSRDAFDFAETTAQNLKNNLNGDWIGWSVEVRDAEGTKYYSLPVMPVREAVAQEGSCAHRARFMSTGPGGRKLLEAAPGRLNREQNCPIVGFDFGSFLPRTPKLICVPQEIFQFLEEARQAGVLL